MQITVDIPDELASPLVPTGQDPARAALEAIGIEAYREHRITGHQLQKLLGIGSRYELDEFLKQHRVWLEYSMEDFEREREVGERLRQPRQAELIEEAERQRHSG
jgi:hypothetical protein